MPEPLPPTELAVPLPGGRRPAGLLLRPWRADDAGAVAALCADPDIARWTPVPAGYRPEDGRVFVAETSPREWAEGSRAHFAVCDAASGEVLASVGLRRSRDDPWHGEIGYWCGAPHRGQGVGTAAVKAVCAWGFDVLGLARIGWRADRGNEASWRVAIQAGFVFEGTQRGGLPTAAGHADAWVAGLRPGEIPAGRVPLPFGPDPVLADGEVTVRRWHEADLGDWVRLRDASVREWDGGVGADEPPDRTVAWQRICVRDVEGWLTGTRASFAICLDGDVAGHVGLRRDRPWAAEVGWWVGAPYRGTGVGTRGVELACRWAAVVGLERLEARIHVDNGPSQALARRCGFRREGRLGGEARRGSRRGDGLLFARDLEP